MTPPKALQIVILSIVILTLTGCTLSSEEFSVLNEECISTCQKTTTDELDASIAKNTCNLIYYKRLDDPLGTQAKLETMIDLCQCYQIINNKDICNEKYLLS